jgi:hypothetical protein
MNTEHNFTHNSTIDLNLSSTVSINSVLLLCFNSQNLIVNQSDIVQSLFDIITVLTSQATSHSEMIDEDDDQEK